jgi:anti-anti-sigma factor
VCHLYSTERELGAVVAAYVRGGLERGEKVGYATGHDVAAVTGWLASERVAWRSAMRSGALVVMTADDLEKDRDGSRATALADRVEAFVEAGVDEGYAALRLASEAQFLAAPRETLDQLRSREALADVLTSERPMTGLCLYDQRCFGWEYLMEVAQAHDDVAPSEVLHRDGILTITRCPSQRELVLVGEIDASNAAALRSALIRHVVGSARELTINTVQLDFIDVAGVRAIADVATAWPQSQVVVHEASQSLVRVVSLCGWDRIPNLDVRAAEG